MLIKGGSITLIGKSYFMEQAIVDARKKQIGENIGKPVEIDFKLHSKEAVKVSL